MRQHRHQKQHNPTDLSKKASYRIRRTPAAAAAPRRLPAAGRHCVSRRWLATVTTAEARLLRSFPPSRQRRSITYLRRDLVESDMSAGTRSADRPGRLRSAHDAGDAGRVQSDSKTSVPSLPARMQQSWAHRC